MSSAKNVSVASLRLPDGEVKQAQFVEDGTIMLLYADKGDISLPSLLSISFKANNSTERSYLLNFAISASSSNGDETGFIPQYSITTDSQSLPTPFDLDIFDNHADIVLHAFPTSGTKSKPVRMNVNGRKERRAACILSADMMHYEVLDIDHPVESEAEE